MQKLRSHNYRTAFAALSRFFRKPCDARDVAVISHTQKMFFCVVAGAAGLCMASQALAQEVVETFTGTISGGQGATDGNPANDPLDLFGGGNLTGDAYVATYVFNTSLGSLQSSACNPARANCPSGTNTLTGAAAVVSETLTINGHSISFPTGTVNSGEMTAFNDGVSFPSGVYDEIDANNDSSSLRNDLGISTGLLPASLVQPFAYIVTPGDGHNPTFNDSFFQYDPPGGNCLPTSCDRFEFSESSVTLAPVPAPSSFLLMLSGIGALVFWGLRRDPPSCLPSA